MHRSTPHVQPHKPVHSRRARRAEKGPGARRAWFIVGVLVIVAATTTGVGVWLHTGAEHPAVHAAHTPTTSGIPVATVPSTTTTSVPVSIAPSVPVPCIPAPVAGGVYAVGDSVLIDAQVPLQTCTPGIEVNAAVSRQWSDGEAIVRQVMAGTPPPAVVVVDLGTNGPITDADFDAMMTILKSASRVVFVTVHVDRPWQDPVNAVLQRGVARYPNAVLADWASLSSQHPEWFYTDGTHLPIGGPGAQALAWLIASKL
jgi:hypothetical protein